MKHLLLLGMATLCLAASCASSSENLKEKKSDIFVNSGVEALRESDFTQALHSFQQALRLTPNSSMIYTNMGIAYAGKKEYPHAEEAFRKAMQISPNEQDARFNLGVLHMRQKRYAEAEKLFKENQKDLAYTNLFLVAYNLGQIYQEQRRPLMAEQQFLISVRERSSYCPAWFELGKLQKERGDYQEAAKSFSGSVSGTCYKDPAAHYEIATLYLKARDIPHAKTKLLEIIQLFPDSEWAKKSEISLNMIR